MSIKQRDEDKTPKRQSQIHNQTHRQTEAWTNREKPKHKQTDIQMKRNTGDQSRNVTNNYLSRKDDV